MKKFPITILALLSKLTIIISILSIFLHPTYSSQKENKNGWIHRTLKIHWKEFGLSSLQIQSNGFLEFENRKYPQPLFHWNSKENNIFFGPNHKIEFPISLLEEVSKSFYTKPFTIVIQFQPNPLKEKLILLQKSIFLNGLEYGMRLNVNQDQVHVEFQRFFFDREDRRKSERLISNIGIQKTKSNQLALVFLPNELKVDLYLNNQHAGSLKIFDKDIVGMGFHPTDSTPWILGKDYYGRIYSFEIYEGLIPLNHLSLPYPPISYNPSTKNAFIPYGIGVSRVFPTQYSHSYLESLSFSQVESNGGYYEIYIRTSLLPFLPSLSENILPWIPLKDFLKLPQCKKNSNELQNCFQYFQLKVLLRPKPNGISSPKLGLIELKIAESIPPSKVTELEVTKDSNPESLKVCLQWKGIQDSKVWDGGSYTIHYGFHPNHLDGMINIPVQERKNIYEFCVDNSIISKASFSYLFEKQMPFFKKGSTVYFRVSAENFYFQENGPGRDQRGELSNLVEFHFPF